MSEMTNWKVPKWPFFVADALLMGFAYYLVMHVPRGTSFFEIAIAAAACVAFGAVLGIVPFVLDYRAAGKALEVNALGAVSEKIQNLEEFTGQITSATNRWAAVQEATGTHAEKTTAAAEKIADRMSAEVREFAEFQKKMNDHEKSTLRLEVEKLRRSESEWLQMLVRILDHVYVLHAAAVRSAPPKVADQITQFQNACRGTVRRIGLATFAAEPNESFDAERFQIADPKQKPFDGAVVAETVAAGYTFQGRLLRPALVRLQVPATSAPVSNIPASVTSIPAPKAHVLDAEPKTHVLDDAPDDLALEQD
jgi:molecular chaperone GrpE (heat shock protein)